MKDLYKYNPDHLLTAATFLWCATVCIWGFGSYFELDEKYVIVNRLVVLTAIAGISVSIGAIILSVSHPTRREQKIMEHISQCSTVALGGSSCLMILLLITDAPDLMLRISMFLMLPAMLMVAVGILHRKDSDD